MKRLLPILALAALAVAADALPAQYRWVRVPGHDDQEALYWQHVQIGTWLHEQGKYYPCSGAGWGEPCPLPAGCRPPIENFGVWRKFVSGHERVTINGAEVTPEHARRVLSEGKSIPDDRGKPFWVIVGSEADCAKACAVLDTPPFKDVGRAQCYRPDDAMIRDRDGRVMYLPGITLVSAAGRALGHTDSYDSAESLREGLRLLGPSYDPQKLPGLKARVLDELLGPAALQAALLAVGAVAFVIFGVLALRRNHP